MGVRETDFGYRELMDALITVGKQQVTAGIFSDSPKHEPNSGFADKNGKKVKEKGEAVPMPLVGAVMEYGTKNAFGKGVKVPARKWFSAGTGDKAQRIWEDAVYSELSAALSDPKDFKEGYRRALKKLGVAMEGTLRRGVVSPTSLGFPEHEDLSYRDGQPLFLSGQLAASIKNKVGEGG